MARLRQDFEQTTISSLGNTSAGLLYWRQQMAEKKEQGRLKREAVAKRHKRRRKRMCVRRRNLLLFAFFLAILSVQQWRQSVRQSIQELVKTFSDESVSVSLPSLPSMQELGTMFQSLQLIKDEDNLEPQIPLSAEKSPLFTYNTLKLYESSRLKAMVGNEDDELPAKPETSLPGTSPNYMDAHLVNVQEPLPDRVSFVPLYWHIPKAGGTTVHDFAGRCLNLTLAHASGTNFGHENDTALQVFASPSKLHFVNVDVTSRQGLQRAKELGFPDHNPSDLMITSLLTATVEHALTPQHQGFAFTIMRHPVERSISMFHYLQKASWEPTFRPEFVNFTLLEYARRPDIDSDWMVRFLVDKPGSAAMNPLSRNDLDVAKRLVREKVMVGFTGAMQASVKRFGERFGWSELPAFPHCLDTLGSSNDNRYDAVNNETEGWKELMAINSLDMELYDYARSIWA